MGKVLSQVMEQRAQVILVAPVWKGESWYPVLLSILWEYPGQIPLLHNLFQSPAELELDFLRLTTQLAVWPISEESSVTAVFQR